MKNKTYITYLVHPERHTNAWISHAGIGASREEAQRNSYYHANQSPWVQTVPISRAPQWAIEQAEEHYQNKSCPACGQAHETGVCINKFGDSLPGKLIQREPYTREFIPEINGTPVISQETFEAREEEFRRREGREP